MDFENRYSLLDRIFYRFAFATISSQVALADMEDRSHKERLEPIDPSSPVFITALPRAGTTILLNLFSELPEFGFHTYQDVPYLLCPLMWSKYSGSLRKNDTPRERAHGDGIMVSSKSPEAFEEMIWKVFWKSQYKQDRIELWEDCDDQEFSDFFAQHMKKIISLRCGEIADEGRYVSKNNFNVARVGGLAKLFPQGKVIIPVREPVQHAASLLNQHKRFLELHSTDRFAKRYMEAIGHYDFGENLRPINFDNWLEKQKNADPTQLSFWIEYWIVGYRYLLKQINSQIHLLCYETLKEQPENSLDRLADLLEMKSKAAFCEQAKIIKAGKAHEIDTEGVEQSLLDEAQDLFKELQAAAVMGQ